MTQQSSENNSSWSLRDDQVVSLIEAVNDRSLACRSEIALERNVDPNTGPVTPEHWQVVLYDPTSLNEKKDKQENDKPAIKQNISIYVSKRYFIFDYAKEILVNAISYLNKIRNNNNEIDIISRQNDKQRSAQGLEPLRKFEGHLFTIKFYDELVVTKLASAYSKITGAEPKMGEDKGADAKLVKYAGHELRGGRHRPFPTFLREVIKLGGLRRLNGSEFSYGVLRAAWYRTRQANKPSNSMIDEEDAQIPPIMTTKRRPGRPKNGSEPSKLQVKLRGEAPDMEELVVEECTDLEVKAIFARARMKG